MGLINENEINNGLYGHKTDLIEQLRKNNVPRWLSPDYPRRYGGGQDITGDESPSKFLQLWREQTRNEHSQRTRYVGFSVDTKRAPESIASKINDYLDSSTHQQEMRFLKPGEYFDGVSFEIEIGSQGGIRDIQLVARYRD
jgi:hypothetical protein